MATHKKTRTAKNAAKKSTDGAFGFRSILEVLKKDHDDLREMIEIMKGERSTLPEKRKAYAQFSALLKSHAKAEEKAVYQTAIKIGALKVDTYEGYEEHAVADELMAKIARTTNTDQWQARVKVIGEMVDHHIKEEENDFLPDLKEKLTQTLESAMIEQFIHLRQGSQKGKSPSKNSKNSKKAIIGILHELPTASESMTAAH